MRYSASVRLILAALTTSVIGSAMPQGASQAQAQQGRNTDKDVIVILRDQLPGVPLERHAMENHATAVANAQGPVLAHLQTQRRHQVHSFATINAFSTRVSAAEAADLAAQPGVAAVVPDRVIRAVRRGNAGVLSAREAAGESVGLASSGPSIATGSNGSGGSNETGGSNQSGDQSDSNAGAVCNTLEPEALQLTNTAFADTSQPQAQQVRDGYGRTVTGRGVKVAFMADGLDPNIAGFIRADGSHVFVDYQDFSGDPAGEPTGAAEAFGDASSIAAQDVSNGKVLSFDISKFVNATHPLPSPCKIRIRGMAPDASLVGLKIFSNLGYTTTSAFVQAIEWAVAHDVDVINESFGGSPFPDGLNDPTSLANAAAVRAGVTVVVSTGDAGTAGTLGSPSTDNDVIAVGASTQFRLYAQTGYGAQSLANGVVSNNISSFSSGGFSQHNPRTVDVVAPGDLGWALCSTNTTLYTECLDFNSPAKPTPVIDFGGTSESAPLTAGEAALIIQAYRSTHRGEDPSPALVKQIIMSTATDLGAPASEQGAGLINSLAAVKLALSIEDRNGRPRSQGNGLLLQPSSAGVESGPDSWQTVAFNVTNSGTTIRHLEPSLQTLGPPLAGATVDVQLNPATDPTFFNPSGAKRSYVQRQFTVPAGVQHLDAAIAYQSAFDAARGKVVYIALLDPYGRQAAYSIPQGVGSSYGHVDVVSPLAGVWTAVIWTRVAGPSSYAGTVKFTWAAERYVTLGSVSPAHLDLAPGVTATLTANFAMPDNPGDLATAVRFTDQNGIGTPAIPLTLRTLVPMDASGGSFSGTLTGGNGRAGNGPTQTFAFDVPGGVNNMSLGLGVSDPGYLLSGYLIDPSGMPLAVDSNADPFVAAPSGHPTQVTTTGTLQLFRSNPRAGRWKFVLLQNQFSSGNQTSLPFSARIDFDTAAVSAPNLPNSRAIHLSASGAPLRVAVLVTNTGGINQFYFADARLNTQVLTSLPQYPCSMQVTLPGACSLFFLPPQATRVQFVSQSTAPIMMDAFNLSGFNVGATGSPDIFARKVGPNTVEASLSAPEVAYGAWLVVPSLIGPYGPGGAPTTPVTSAALAVMQPFDAAVSADSGDTWLDITKGTNTFNPLALPPGQSGLINLTITPDPTQVGRMVSGFLYIDTFSPTSNSGDEVVRLPYSYTVDP